MLLDQILNRFGFLARDEPNGEFTNHGARNDCFGTGTAEGTLDAMQRKGRESPSSHEYILLCLMNGLVPVVVDLCRCLRGRKERRGVNWSERQTRNKERNTGPKNKVQYRLSNVCEMVPCNRPHGVRLVRTTFLLRV